MRSLLFAFLPLVVGCGDIPVFPVVSVSAPVGPKATAEDLAWLVGTWVDPHDTTVRLRVHVSEERDLVLTRLNVDEKKAKRVGQRQMVIDARQCGPNLILFYPLEDDVMPFMPLMLVQSRVGHAEVFLPDAIAFRDAVESGSVTGKIFAKGSDAAELLDDESEGLINVNLKADKKLDALLSEVNARPLFRKEPGVSFDRLVEEENEK